MKPIVVSQTLEAPKDKIWSAITDREEMVQWYFEQIREFRPEKGFSTAFDVESGGRVFRHQWEVTEVVPGERITYSWDYPDYPGEGLVSFELEEKEEGTLIRVLNWGIETFPQEIPEFSRESCKAGWEHFIQGRLREYVEGRPA
ncbi:SRPBCC domain-containing protein [Zeaxanthinibacter sp. PT1]|uniref:SRPBCC family protein n=1 Tax=Zeaxanthinibacter TaxID=561554 RepID=UPI00234966A1|nr:SRPBCC domain-containing protein [Zeaxanthinibacter sp. PT1]MDC6349997.1 SRPBCC domain-containing protein [Zeaxanthinibacter sp. PT1]